MIPIGEARADDLVKAIAECMTRSNLDGCAQLDVLNALIDKLTSVRAAARSDNGPADDELIDD